MYWLERDARAFDHHVFDLYVRPGMTVADVGANIGALTVHASRLTGPIGRVIAFAIGEDSVQQLGIIVYVSFRRYRNQEMRYGF